MDKNIKENIVRPSDFYWGFFMITSLSLLILHYIESIYLGTDEYLSLFLGFITALIGIIITHSNKIRNKLDYSNKLKEDK